MRRLHYLLLVLCLFASGCSAFLKNPTVTVKDLNVVSLSGEGAGMELYLVVENPNGFDVTMKGYNYDLKVMALPLAHGGAREEVRFPGKTATDMRIPVRVGYGDLVEILKRRPDPDNVPYQLSAGLELDTPMGQVTVPVEKRGSYAIPKEYRPSFLFGRLGELLNMMK